MPEITKPATNRDPGNQDPRPDADLLGPASQSTAGLDLRPPDLNGDLSTFCWSVTAILLTFLCLTHLGVLLCFSVGARVSPFVAPAALLLSLVVGRWLAQKEGWRGRWRIAPPALALVLVGIALFLAASFFDFGWDGLWYHQTAVYQMSHGWNPLRDPMHSFVPHLQDWVRHYSKGPWYVALALFETTHNIELAKAGTWIALAAMFLATFAASIDFGMQRRAAIVIAALVSLNPVAVCESASYLVDGLMVSFLACFVAATFCWFRRPSLLIHGVLIASAILCINAKLTGLVYLCFACAAAGIYALLRRRDVWIRCAILQLACVLLGSAVFGFNPYVTNTVHRGNPFYPWLGTAAHPSFSQRGQDPGELYETPKNLIGRNRLVRLGYAIFGRPGAQPVCGGENAQLMWPFDVGWKDFNMFRIHGIRISGFGPLFSAAFVTGLVLMGAVWVRPGRRRMKVLAWGEAADEPPSFQNQEARQDARPTQSGMSETKSGVPREVLLLFAGTTVASLLISTHTWWARYGPQLWWLPIIAVIAGLRVPDWNAARRTAWGLAALLLVNTTLVAFAHFRWEIEATRTLREQMASLRQQGEVEVDFQYFGEPFGERLRAAGVNFRAVRRLSCDHPMELMSVAPGYPAPVRVCADANPPKP